MSSSAERGTSLTLGAEIGANRSKSYNDKSMSPKISSVWGSDVDDDVAEEEDDADGRL